MIHYRYTQYIPINRFDVLETLGQAPIAADRRSYGRTDASADIQVSDDGRNWFQARLVDESLVGFGAITAGSIAWRPGTLLLVHLAGHENVPCILVWRRRVEKETRFGLRALQFVATYRLSPLQVQIARPTAIVRLTHSSNEQLTWSEFYRVLGLLNKLVESAALLLDTLAQAAGVDLHLAPPMLKSIVLQSPGDIQVKVDLGVAETVRAVSDLAYVGLERRKRDLENTMLQMAAIREAVNLGADLREAGLSQEDATRAMAPILHKLGIDNLPVGAFNPNSLESGIVREQLLPAAAELNAGYNPHIQVEVETAN